ncbi:MAG: D-alanyl-D-alanine carboxypeptidase family protein [Ruminococcaceae bacterium]|nr:D-alanyl-D-alanine carboxypeptidase family protein [Oscillospiraceae bacterium]
MNNSPENRNTQSESGQYRASRSTPSRAQSGQPQNQYSGNTQRRPLNDEDRRRMEAARQAAMRSNVSRDAEIRRRREDQQKLAGGAMYQQSQYGGQSQYSRQTHAQQANQAQQNQRRRKKKKFKINIGAIIFVLLIGTVIGVSVNQIAKNNENIVDDDNKLEFENDLPGDTISGNETTDQESESEDTDEPDLILHDTIYVENSTMDEGNLILVNYQYEYKKVDQVELKNAYENKTGKLKVSSTSLAMTPEAFDALEAMVIDLEEDTGCDDLLLNSAYRNAASQQYIYNDYVNKYGEDYAESYVADPGFSEHHTGLACDLTFYTDDGKIVPITDHEFGSWLGVNCIQSGFVRRYPQDKVDITKIAYEAWHFRYVGIPHAYAIFEMDYCLEEYITWIKDYTFDGNILHVKKSGALDDVSMSALPVEDGWLIYYVPADEGDNTEILIPRGEKYSDYEISGNNVDGFIVTITLD